MDNKKNRFKYKFRTCLNWFSKTVFNFQKLKNKKKLVWKSFF